MIKKILLSTVAASVLASTAFAEVPSDADRIKALESQLEQIQADLNAPSIREQGVDAITKGVKATGAAISSGFSATVEAGDDYVVEPVVDASKYVGGKVADGAVATGKGLAYTFNMTHGVLKAGFVESQGVSGKIGGGLAAILLTPVMLTIDVLDLVVDGVTNGAKQLDKLDGKQSEFVIEDENGAIVEPKTVYSNVWLNDDIEDAEIVNVYTNTNYTGGKIFDEDDING